MRRAVGWRGGAGSLIGAEVTALVVGAVVLAAGGSRWLAAGLAVGVAVCGALVTVAGLAAWQWLWVVARWVRHRRRRLKPLQSNDIEVDRSPVGVIVDGHTVVTMVAVWGKPYMPTLLHARHAETRNTLPVSVVAAQMRRFGLAVDVDVICAGRRAAADHYADVYSSFLGGRPAAGRRATTLVLRLDTRAGDTTTGLLWRPNTAVAAATAAQRMARALRKTGCRAQVLTAGQMREAALTAVGGAEEAGEAYRDEWTALHRPGRGYVTSYFLSASDVVAAQVDDVWSYDAQHTTLVVALRRHPGGVRASVAVRLTTAQPLLTAPSPALNRFTGCQWEALSATLPGRARLTGLPAADVVGEELDSAVVVGPSGVMLGKLGDDLLLMPLSDPSGPTRVAFSSDDDMAVRRLIRRAAAARELVAVYDSSGAWTMQAKSSNIWTSRDMGVAPPRPPTLVVHNGNGSEPYPGAWVSVAVNGAGGADPDIVIDHRGDRIHLGTKRFSTVVEAVSFRNELPYLN